MLATKWVRHGVVRGDHCGVVTSGGLDEVIGDDRHRQRLDLEGEGRPQTIVAVEDYLVLGHQQWRHDAVVTNAVQEILIQAFLLIVEVKWVRAEAASRDLLDFWRSQISG